MKNEFRKGLLNGLPICLGYLSVSFAFGIFAVENGMTPLEALLLSMCCLTSAGQLAAVPLIGALGGLGELALAQLVINLRYSLMSISLGQKLDENIRLRDRFLIAFGNTDEVFAVAGSQRGNVSKWYFYGLICLPWVGWSTGTVLGALAGNILPEAVTTALGVAIYGMFIAIVIPEGKKSRPVAACVLLAIALSCLFYFVPGLNAIPSGFTIILCACAASGIMAILAPVKKEENDRDT